MAESKTYLNVPYAQKDAAKALGAKWDAAIKKWYVPADKDVTVFAKWQTEATVLESPTPAMSKPKPRSTSNNRSPANDASQGVFTRATVKDFVAYNGDEPPWD